MIIYLLHANDYNHWDSNTFAMTYSWRGGAYNNIKTKLIYNIAKISNKCNYVYHISNLIIFPSISSVFSTTTIPTLMQEKRQDLFLRT